MFKRVYKDFLILVFFLISRVSAIFRPDSGSDNCMISIYPFGDEFYAFTETPVIHR